MTMTDLIKALTIFAKYKNSEWPTHCEHDVLYIMDITFDEVSPDDRDELVRLGFDWDKTEDVWYSFKFGSA